MRRLSESPLEHVLPRSRIAALAAALALSASACGPDKTASIQPVESVMRPAVTPAERDDVFVTIDNTLAQYDAHGTLKGDLAIPYPPERPFTETARDLMVDGDARIVIFNGTFAPLLSRLEPVAGTWSHHALPGWSTINNVSYGGIAGNPGTSVYVTDMATAGDGAPRGIIRLHPAADTMTRVSEDADYIDMAFTVTSFDPIAALRSDGRTVDSLRLDMACASLPECPMSVQRTIQLEAEVRAIAITDAAIFGAAWDGTIYRFDNSGAIVQSIASGAMNLIDIDLAADRQAIAVGSRFGDVVLTDVALSPPTSFNAGTGPVFVAFKDLAADLPGAVEPPGPPSVPLDGITAAASSSYSSRYYSAANLVDGNSNSLWVGGWRAQPWTVTLDLGQSAELDQLELDWYYSYVSMDFDVLVSADGGQTYVPLAEGLAAEPMTAWPYRSTFTLDLDRAVATHVRVVIRSVSRYFPVMSEVRVTGWAAD